MARPSGGLVLDAAILAAAARGEVGAALLAAARQGPLLTTERALHEAVGALALVSRRPELIPVLANLARLLDVVPTQPPGPSLAEADRALCLAGGEADPAAGWRPAELLALAWAAGADIWTDDGRFAGAGVATWSTATLSRALAA